MLIYLLFYRCEYEVPGSVPKAIEVKKVNSLSTTPCITSLLCLNRFGQRQSYKIGEDCPI